MTVRFADMYKPAQKKREDNRTTDEIVDHIWSKITG